MPREKKASRLESPTCSDRLIWDICESFNYLPTVVAMDELDLFSFLAKRPSTGEEIAKSFTLEPYATEAVLGILSSIGLLIKLNGHFHITEETRNYLLPDSPFYWGPMLQTQNPNSPIGRMKGAVLKALKEETGSRRIVTTSWDNEQPNMEFERSFIGKMHSHSFPAAMCMARNGDFTGVERLLDIGGGSGCFCIALATRYPNMHFTIMERPVVCELADEYITEYGLKDQIDTKAVNMFNQVWPTGYDAIFFSNIYHDWDDDHCLKLSQTSFEMLPSGGRIYLHEMLLNDDKSGPLTAAAFSLIMAMQTGGKQRTAAEISRMLQAVGFDEITVTQTHHYYSLISARKPGR